MSRFAMMSAVTLGAFALAGQALGAPAIPDSVDVSPFMSSAVQADLKAGGAPFDTSSMVNAGAAIGNGALSAANSAMSAKDAASDNVFGATAPLTSGDLGGMTGGSSIIANIAMTEQTLSATNTGNTMTVGGSLTNGPVSVDSGAFAGFSGVGNFLMNTGNQNNVQGTLNVNIVLAPPVAP